MEEEDEDPVGILLQLLDELLINRPGSLLEKTAAPPSREELSDVLQDPNALLVLTILRRYIRPRNEVLEIRRVVNSACENGQIEGSNVYTRHAQLKAELERLKFEKDNLHGNLMAIKATRIDVEDVRNTVMGDILLQKNQKELQVLKVYREHLQMLQTEKESVDNQTTLDRTKSLASLLSPSTSARRQSFSSTESELEKEKENLIHTLQLSTPKQILQSMSFLSTITAQSLAKQYPPNTQPRAHSAAEKLEIEISLFALKQCLITTCDKLKGLQTTIASIPKKEYATTEAKCRALRAAKMEALDRLDELISSSSRGLDGLDEWNEDVNAAKELIDERIAKIKGLVDTYYGVRGEVQRLQDDIKNATKTFLAEPSLSSLKEMDIQKPSDYPSTEIKSSSNGAEQQLTVTQLEKALCAKWKIESSQRSYTSMQKEVTISLDNMKNETLYNLSLESPLLRDADLFDALSIPRTWKDASSKKMEILKEWMRTKIRNTETSVGKAENKLEVIRLLEAEAEALETLGENVF